VLNRPLSLLETEHGPAVGSAIHAAVAAGVHPDVAAAAEVMGRKREGAFLPDPDRARAYDALYAEYRRLYDWFGRDESAGGNEVMHRLRDMRRAARRGRDD